MEVKKSIAEKYIMLIFTFITSCFLITLTDKITFHIAGVVLFALVAMIQVRFDLLHPYCWFSGFFCLYSIGYPLLVAMGYDGVGYSKEIMMYQLLALFICLLFITPVKKISSLQVGDYNLKISMGIFNSVIYIITALVIILSVFYVNKSGFSGKDEIYTTGNYLLIIAFRLPLILSLLYTISAISCYIKNKKFPQIQTFFVSIVLLSITLFSGERDFIFRFLVMNVMILWFFKLLKGWHMLIIVPIFAFLIPLSSIFKYYFLRGQLFQSKYGLFYSFLSGEFESSARNLQVLINNSNLTKGTLGFIQIFKDMISVFNSNLNSPSAWFTETFYSGRQTQYGFSLVGEGYVIGGITGIVVLFIIIGLLIKFFYINSQRNIYTLSSYLYFITTVIYSIRGDFGIILSAIIKQIGFVILLLYIIRKLENLKLNG